MEILNFIISLLLLISIVFLFLFIKQLLPSYFKEKGKNLATKEDIEEITEKVKTVESKINIITGNVIDYTSIKRKYILEYFAALNNWERIISNTEIDYSSNNESINRDRLERILEAKHQYNLKEGEIELFIDKDEFFETKKVVHLPLKYK